MKTSLESAEALVQNTNLPAREKRKRALQVIKRLNKDLRVTEAERSVTQSQLEHYTNLHTALSQYEDWADTINKFALTKNSCSRLHKLAAAIKFAARDDKELYSFDVFHMAQDLEGIQDFVIQHDWAAAFEKASDYHGEYNLPYPLCAFEFSVLNKNITALVGQNEKYPKTATIVWANFNNEWVAVGKESEHVTDGIKRLTVFIDSQVEAICIAMDAEIAITEIQRQPEKLNKKRQESSKLPLYDYHIVRLNREKHDKPETITETDYRKKRLHFRRGHWRHYEDFKTWIKWTLVGDPDLGFVDKEYRL